MIQEDYFYTWQKLHEAIHSLVSNGQQWQRISGAYEGIRMLKKDDLPSHLHDKYDSLKDILEKYRKEFENLNDKSEGFIFFAARSMSEDERQKCCHMFISLYDSVTRYRPAG